MGQKGTLRVVCWELPKVIRMFKLETFINLLTWDWSAVRAAARPSWVYRLFPFFLRVLPVVPVDDGCSYREAAVVGWAWAKLLFLLAACWAVVLRGVWITTLNLKSAPESRTSYTRGQLSSVLLWNQESLIRAIKLLPTAIHHEDGSTYFEGLAFYLFIFL